MESNRLNMYLWQVDSMPNDPLYRKMKIEYDYQLAVDRDDFSKFASLLEDSEDTSFVCLLLPPGQPHSCDDRNEVWGKPTKIFTRLVIKKELDDRDYGVVDRVDEVVTLHLDQKHIQSFVKVMRNANEARVFYEYEHFVLLENSRRDIVRLNFWGWCQNGQIEYAN